MKNHVIVGVDPDGIAGKHGLCAGDVLCRINSENIRDVFDYQHQIKTSTNIRVAYLTKSGVECETVINNNGEDIGLIFENSLMDQYQKCRNNCVFCFVGQLPPTLRSRLSLREDDCRKAFFPWNRYEAYSTLVDTPMSEIERYIKYGLGPINVSIHSTEPDVRVKIFRNSNARDTMDKLKRFYDAGIEMNALIVLCPGLNDGMHLEKTLEDLFKLAPVLKTVAIGPVGLTKYRQGKEMIRLFSEDDAVETLQIIEKYQRMAMEKYNIVFAHGSDLLYYLANRAVPDSALYDGGLYRQLGNGVGMVRRFVNEFNEQLALTSTTNKRREISVATGKAFYSTMEALLARLSKKAPGITVHLYEIQNDYFGGNVAIAGLITGEDLLAQLRGKNLGSELLLSSEMIGGSGKFIDGIEITSVEKELGVTLNFNTKSGADFLREIVVNEG